METCERNVQRYKRHQSINDETSQTGIYDIRRAKEYGDRGQTIFSSHTGTKHSFHGMTGTNDSTAMASFSTEPSSLDSQKTTQLEDVKLVEQSTQRLQTTIEKITEPNTS